MSVPSEVVERAGDPSFLTALPLLFPEPTLGNRPSTRKVPERFEKISDIAKRPSVVSFARHVVPVSQPGGRLSQSRVPPLEPDLVAFIEGAFPSVWALETLLVLRRDSAAPWTSALLVSELRASGPLVDDCLRCLIRAGLVVEADDAFRYAPANARLDALCDALDAAYRERPVAVTNAIATRRPDALKGFADSFRLGGWKS